MNWYLGMYLMDQFFHLHVHFVICIFINTDKRQHLFHFCAAAVLNTTCCCCSCGVLMKIVQHALSALLEILAIVSFIIQAQMLICHVEFLLNI